MKRKKKPIIMSGIFWLITILSKITHRVIEQQIKHRANSIAQQLEQTVLSMCNIIHKANYVLSMFKTRNMFET